VVVVVVVTRDIHILVYNSQVQQWKCQVVVVERDIDTCVSYCHPLLSHPQFDHCLARLSRLWWVVVPREKVEWDIGLSKKM
jgi:hypothetical protein